MKHFFSLRPLALTIILAALCLSACHKDFEESEEGLTFFFSESDLAELRTKTCLTKDADDSYALSETPEDGVSDRASGKKNKFWAPGQRIRVRFLNGSATLQNKVFAYAQQWESYANVDFVRVSSGTAEIRVAFDRDGHWSYLGKENLSIPANRKTMNLEFNEGTPDVEVRRTTLHEFGHALGLMHEHQHPMNNIPWNKSAAYAFYQKTQGWSRKEVDDNVLNKNTWESSQHTDFDAKSIMEYPVPQELTLGNYEIGWNTTLSSNDKYFIGQVYSDKRFRVRHAVSTSSTISFWLNGIYHTLKPGESLWVPAKTSNNQLAIWECVNGNCGWDSYSPPYGKNYRIVAQGSNGNLTLQYD